MKRTTRGTWIDIRVLLLYSVLAVAYAWPLVSRFASALAGDGFDMYVFQWGNWWITRSLAQGQSPYHTAMLFHPQGANLYFLSFSWLNTFVWWLLCHVVGNEAAYNFTVWWSWPLAGLGCYMLAKEVTGDRRAALIAGLIYAFYPYHFAQRNHINLLSIQWIPLALLFLIRVYRRGRARDGVLAGLFLACAGLAGWHLLTLSGMLGGLWLVYAWFTERGERAEGSWRALLIAVLVVVALAGPVLAPIVWEQVANPGGQDPYLGREGETQADLVAYFLPNLYHPLWGQTAAPVHSRFLRSKDHAMALGYLPLALVGLGLARWRKTAKASRFWFWGLLVFWLLALGPFPRINGIAYPEVPLPYRLVGWSLPVQSLRSPARFNILVGLCLAMVASIAVRGVLHNARSRRAGLLVLFLGVIVMLEYWAWPFPTTRPDIHVFYSQLAADPDDFAIVDLPITNDLSKRYMYYQTAHGRPTVTGHVSRPPEGAYDFIHANGLLRAMWQGRRPDSDGDPVAELESLDLAGVRYLLVHRDLLSEEEFAALDTYLPVAPVYADQTLVVYPTRVEVIP